MKSYTDYLTLRRGWVYRIAKTALRFRAMTVIRRRCLPGAICDHIQMMRRKCVVEVTGLADQTGLVLFDLRDCQLCFTWHLSRLGLELRETEESRRFTRFESDTQRSLWLADWSKRRMRRWLLDFLNSMSPYLSWNDGTVVKVAKTIAQEQSFHLLPVLADALEEAGCTDAHILDHCRRTTERVEQSWVVDDTEHKNGASLDREGGASRVLDMVPWKSVTVKDINLDVELVVSTIERKKEADMLPNMRSLNRCKTLKVVRVGPLQLYFELYRQHLDAPSPIVGFIVDGQAPCVSERAGHRVRTAKYLSFIEPDKSKWLPEPEFSKKWLEASQVLPQMAGTSR